MHVSLDGRRMSPPEGFLIRKGPGNCLFDFAQQINFGGGSSVKLIPAVRDVSSRVGYPTSLYIFSVKFKLNLNLCVNN